MTINQKMEAMLQEVQNGNSVDNAIQTVLGGGIKPEGVRKEVQALLSKAAQLEEKYVGTEWHTALFQEVAEQCGGNCAEQFRQLSEWKRLSNLRNLRISESILREQGTNVEFMRQTIERAYEEEQRMAAAATPEELSALQDELVQSLPTEKESLREVLREAAQEDAAPLLELLDAPQGTPQTQEDFSVMLAAAILSERPDVSEEEAAAAAVLGANQGASQRKLQFLWMALPVTLAAMVGSLLLTFLAAMAGLSLLSEVGLLLFKGTAVGLALLSLAAAGAGVYLGAKKAAELARDVWPRCKPYVLNAANKVKAAVLAVAGVLTGTVFRPAIRWVSQTALPVIREKVIHPLKRRLEGLLGWLKEKKDQFVQFVRDAAAPQSQETPEQTDEEPQLVYDVEDATEGNWIFA